MELPRQPGTRETRWAHLLSGAPAVDETALGDRVRRRARRRSHVGNVRVRDAVAALQDEVCRALKAALAKLRDDLGDVALREPPAR